MQYCRLELSDVLVSVSLQRERWWTGTTDTPGERWGSTFLRMSRSLTSFLWWKQYCRQWGRSRSLEACGTWRAGGIALLGGGSMAGSIEAHDDCLPGPCASWAFRFHQPWKCDLGARTYRRSKIRPSSVMARQFSLKPRCITGRPMSKRIPCVAGLDKML